MSTALIVKQGDTLTPWTDRLERGGAAIDLTEDGTTVTLFIKQTAPVVAGASVVVREADILTPATDDDDNVSYTPVAADVATPGRFALEWRVQTPSGRLTVPSNGTILLTVEAALSTADIEESESSEDSESSEEDAEIPVFDGLISQRVADLEVYQDVLCATPATADGDPVRGWKNQDGVISSSATAGTLRLNRYNGKASIEVAGTSRFNDAVSAVTSGNACTFFWVLATTDRHTNTHFAHIGDGATYAFAYFNGQQLHLFDNDGDHAGGGNQLVVPPQVFLVSITCTATATKIRVNGRPDTTSATVADDAGKTGLHFGGSTIGGALYTLTGDLLFEAAYDRILTDEERDEIETALMEEYYQLPPAVEAGARLCVWEGDSIASAYGVAGIADEHWSLAQDDLPEEDRFTVRNVGVPSSYVAQVAARIDLLISLASGVTGTKVLQLWVGTNDRRDGTSYASIIAATQSICSAVRSYYDYIVIWDILPRVENAPDAGRAAGEALWDSYFTVSTGTTRIKQNDPSVTWADRLVQISRDPVLGLDASVADAAIYPDGVHPSSSSSQVIIAGYETAVLAQLVAL